ncbi:MAG: TonB-dependent receptor, partial [Rubritalea sp.]|uniref:TonB-dependent receptor domain-containing protein n=1 Tax=Rubritalea sp. TaxID=2109375 RepID=UPI003242DB3D
PASNGLTSTNINYAGEALVSGFETSLRGGFIQNVLKYDLAWTAQLKEEVIDVPDHIVSGNFYYDADVWVLGFGASYADGASYGNSEDTNFVPTDSRFVTRLFGHYQINENLKLHGRIENLFDEKYLLSDIYGDQIQAQGLGAFGGLTLTF